MSIAENVFIGREPGSGVFVNWRKMAAETRAITDRLGLSVRPTTIVRDLNVAEQQMVEIARALSMESRLIVMDEPTSALSSSEVEKLFAIIRDLKAHGLSIVFVTHRLEEVMQICDRYTVLRDGQSGRQRRGRRYDDRRHHPPDGRARGERALRASRRGDAGRGRAEGGRPDPPRQYAGRARGGA